jgi:hypothetical protein
MTHKHYVPQHNILSPGLPDAQDLCVLIVGPNHTLCTGVKLGLSLQKKRAFWIKVLRTSSVLQIQLCHHKRSRNRRDCNRTGQTFCFCMLIKTNFVTEYINYTEVNTETISGACWNIMQIWNSCRCTLVSSQVVLHVGYQYGFMAVAASDTKIHHHVYRSHFWSSLFSVASSVSSFQLLFGLPFFLHTTGTKLYLLGQATSSLPAGVRTA